MKLPRYIHEFLSKKFDADQMITIDSQWDRFACISFGNATDGELIRTAEMVLRCAAESTAWEAR